MKNDENIYLDQTIVSSQIGDRIFSAPYTPEGIKMLDTMYANCIMAGIGTPEKLKKHIEENPHLHPTLKNNLILNLRHFGKASCLGAEDKKLLEKSLYQRSLMFFND